MPATLSILRRILVFVLLLNGFASCYKNHLYVQQQTIDRDFLASTKIGTPDPLQADPPTGQRLLVAWDFPKSEFRQPLTIKGTIRFWDNSETMVTEKMEKKRDFTTFFFPSKEKEKKILTYRIDVVNEKGEVLESWKHHFWTELITMDASSRSSSVSLNPKQGSVSDKP